MNPVLQYNVYRRKLDTMGVLMVLAADVSLAASRLWLHVQAAYLWVRFRHDSEEDQWMTAEDLYCALLRRCG